MGTYFPGESRGNQGYTSVGMGSSRENQRVRHPKCGHRLFKGEFQLIVSTLAMYAMLAALKLNLHNLLRNLFSFFPFFSLSFDKCGKWGGSRVLQRDKVKAKPTRMAQGFRMCTLSVNGLSWGIPEELQVSLGRDTALKWLLTVLEFLFLHWQEISTRLLFEGLLSLLMSA